VATVLLVGQLNDIFQMLMLHVVTWSKHYHIVWQVSALHNAMTVRAFLWRIYVRY